MIIDKSLIAPKLTKLKSIVPTKTQDGIQGVLLKDRTLTATNNEIALKMILNEALPDEEFIIPIKAISLIENLPDGVIEIAQGKDFSIIIKAENIKNKFQSQDPKLFIELDANKNSKNNTGFSSEILEKSIKSILFAVGNDNIKPIINGAYFESKEGFLNIVGTDGFKMAWNKVKHSDEFNFIVPKTSLQKLLSIGISDGIEITYNNKIAIFRTDEFEFYTRLIEGKYIPYKTLFNKTNNSTIINKKLLLEALKRSIICMEEKKGVIKFKLEGKKLEITINSAISDYKEDLQLETDIDNTIEIGFNIVYLTECIKSFSSENIELYFSEPNKAMLLDDGELTAILLPVRTR